MPKIITRRKTMKKIVSILVIAVLLLTSALVALPASAATKTLEIDWTKLAFRAYSDTGAEIDETTFLSNFTVTKDATTFGVSRNGTSGNSCSYVSTSQFAITATTDYTYEVMGKNNNTTKYSGIPFAIDSDGIVYFIYGSFDNNNDSDDSQSGKSYVISAKGDFDNKYPNSTNNELDSMYFAKLLQTGGFASFKFEYNGLTVSIYAKDSSGNYIQMGENVTLPEGSKLVFGVFSRDATNGGNRTTTVKNGKITGNNDEAVSNMVLESNNGAGDLKAEILTVEQNYLEPNYTVESYAAVKTALENAKKVADDFNSSADDVSAAMTALQNAVLALELKEVDFTKLEAALDKAEKVDENKWSDVSYTMLSNAVKVGEDLLLKLDATQVEVDKATSEILARIESLTPSGIDPGTDDEDANVDDKGGDEDGEKENEDEEDNTATQAPATQAPAPVKKGCKSAAATTAVVVGFVATLGTALVIKKKD